jgi:hypothetical protein
MAEAKAATSHDVIRRWAEERGGRPATVKDTATDDEVGILRLDLSRKMSKAWTW